MNTFKKICMTLSIMLITHSAVGAEEVKAPLEEKNNWAYNARLSLCLDLLGQAQDLVQTLLLTTAERRRYYEEYFPNAQVKVLFTEFDGLLTRLEATRNETLVISVLLTNIDSNLDEAEERLEQVDQALAAHRGYLDALVERAEWRKQQLFLELIQEELKEMGQKLAPFASSKSTKVQHICSVHTALTAKVKVLYKNACACNYFSEIDAQILKTEFSALESMVQATTLVEPENNCSTF